MGLRERKAARSRQTMTDVALELFLRDGFEETTMEQIAERAEVGTTTLYRYFPTKDQLLLDPLVEAIDPAPYLRARPADERLEISLGEALLAAAAAFDDAGTPHLGDAPSGGCGRRATREALGQVPDAAGGPRERDRRPHGS